MPGEPGSGGATSAGDPAPPRQIPRGDSGGGSRRLLRIYAGAAAQMALAWRRRSTCRRAAKFSDWLTHTRLSAANTRGQRIADGRLTIRISCHTAAIRRSRTGGSGRPVSLPQAAACGRVGAFAISGEAGPFKETGSWLMRKAHGGSRGAEPTPAVDFDRLVLPRPGPRGVGCPRWSPPTSPGRNEMGGPDGYRISVAHLPLSAGCAFRGCRRSGARRRCPGRVGRPEQGRRRGRRRLRPGGQQPGRAGPSRGRAASPTAAR